MLLNDYNLGWGALQIAFR